MNKEKYNQIVDDVYKRYRQYITHSINNGWDISRKDLKEEDYGFTHLSKELFVNKIKTDLDFSEKWGLKIEERELSYIYFIENITYIMAMISQAFHFLPTTQFAF